MCSLSGKLELGQEGIEIGRKEYVKREGREREMNKPVHRNRLRDREGSSLLSGRSQLALLADLHRHPLPPASLLVRQPPLWPGFSSSNTAFSRKGGKIWLLSLPHRLSCLISLPSLLLFSECPWLLALLSMLVVLYIVVGPAGFGC
jgi:hypothetical protein